MHPQKLDDYERDEGYEVRWLTLDEAIALNKAADSQTTWVQRELAVLKRMTAGSAVNDI